MAGKSADSRLSDALRKRVSGVDPSCPDGLRYLERIANKLCRTAVDADGAEGLQAIKEIFDRIEGKPKQAIDMTSDNTTKIISDKPLTTEEWARQYGAEIAPKSNGKAH